MIAMTTSSSIKVKPLCRAAAADMFDGSHARKLRGADNPAGCLQSSSASGSVAAGLIVSTLARFQAGPTKIGRNYRFHQPRRVDAAARARKLRRRCQVA
jgi:hypothetical protein